MLTTYQEFREKISDRIHDVTRWRITDSRLIANELVELVKKEGKWTNYGSFGTFETSAYQTLREFLNVLEHQSFGISENQLRDLIRSYRTTGCIESLCSFIHRRVESEHVKKRTSWQQLYTKISNAPSAIDAKIRASYEQLKTTTKLSLAELRNDLSKYSTWFKIFTGLIGLVGSYVFDSEVVVGPIPLGGMGIDSPTSIQEIEVAHSNKVVKFRAVGSIYLAHQIGGKDSIKITGKLTGDLRLYFLAAIWTLTLISQGKIKIIEDGKIKSSQDQYWMRSGTGSLIYLSSIPLSSKSSVTTEKPHYEYHVTFPVITEHEIIPNCYIESFSFEEKLVNNKDVITYDLMLREYEEPVEFITDSKATTLRAGTRKTQTEEIIRYGMNFMYRLLRMEIEINQVDNNNWKVQNYYDVDEVDCAFAFSTAIGGMLAGGY